MNKQKSRPPRAGRQYKGSYRRGGRYIAVITMDRRQRWLGAFDTAEEAARAYDQAAREAFGDGAILNFPQIDKAAGDVPAPTTIRREYVRTPSRV